MRKQENQCENSELINFSDDFRETRPEAKSIRLILEAKFEDDSLQRRI